MPTSHTSVNLGGWFIPEKWMSPSLFAGTNANDLASLLSTPSGKKRYKAHLKSWITNADFAWLAAHGITLVRLPIGYWALEVDGIFPATKRELNEVFRMAEHHGIKIQLDLHALKGSQNGHDHSGKKGSVEWEEYETESLALLEALALRYRDSPSLWGIEIINEPTVFGHYWALRRYYNRAYRTLSRTLRPGQYTVFQDGFMPLLFMGTLRGNSTHPIAMDTHLYAIMLPHIVLPERVYAWLQHALFGSALRITQLFQPVIVGEWSGVLPQAMFDRLPKKDHAELMQRNIARQQVIYRHAHTNMYWNYKTEAAGMWNFRSLVDDGTILLS